MAGASGSTSERGGLGAVSDPPKVDLVVVQPTPFCNIACTYCYLPARDDRSVIAQETVRNLFAKLFAAGWCEGGITIIWHAGEPLVVPIDFYRDAFRTIASLRPPELQIVHSFQTNGMLITPAWCDLFKEWNVDVGVSIDGPRALHDRHRVTRAGRGTFDRTIAGIRLLQQEGVEFHTISVLSHDSLDQADALHDFFVAEGIEHVCFNVEETEGQHVSDLTDAAEAAARYRTFLARFWELSRRAGKVRFLREIDGLISTIFRPDEAPIRNNQVEPLGMLNVDCKGNVSSFSPELLGYRNAEYDDFLIGNVNTDDFEQIRARLAASALQRDIAAGVEACRASCDYFSVCGGGAPINKLSENGSFNSTRTVFCAMTQMAPVDVVLAAVERHEAVV
jgi:uncharacterized protein